MENLKCKICGKYKSMSLVANKKDLCQCKKKHVDFLEKLADFLEENNVSFTIAYYPGLKYSCFYTGIKTSNNSEANRLIAQTEPFDDRQREEYKAITPESIREKIKFFKGK